MTDRQLTLDEARSDGLVQAQCYACGHNLWESCPRLQCAKCGTEPPPNPGERFLQYEDGELVKIECTSERSE